MSVLVSSGRTISGLYQFSVAGGAVGAIATGVFVAANSSIKMFFAKTIQNFTSGGAMTLSFTLVGPTVTTTLLVPTGFAAFVAPTLTPGVDFNANPVNIIETSEVFFNIGAFAATAGQISFQMDYNQNSI